MNKLDRALKGHRYIVFMDFEGTQFSHEMISLGAVITKLDKNNKAIATKKPFQIYVKAKNKIGKYVTDLTGITEEKLKTDGVSFKEALMAFKKYCGLAFKKASFCTFGSHDMRILGQSFMYNIDSPKEITSQIQKNYFDLTVFLNEFVRDDKGNALSLVHALEMFKVPLEGIAHDSMYDAVNLCTLYNAFISNPDILMERYKKALFYTNHLPDPITAIVRELLKGNTVSPEQFDEEVKKYIK